MPLRVSREGNEVRLEVRDQGKGMPSSPNGASHAHRKMGVGIQGMRERITQLGGRFEIRSGKKGTTVVASVPVPSVAVQTATQVAP